MGDVHVGPLEQLHLQPCTSLATWQSKQYCLPAGTKPGGKSYSEYTKMRILHFWRKGHRAPSITRILRSEGLNTSRRGVFIFLCQYARHRTIHRWDIMQLCSYVLLGYKHVCIYNRGVASMALSRLYFVTHQGGSPLPFPPKSPLLLILFSSVMTL